ncbi:hypothetical protein SESBI_01594 [Sesbania bispinosa]|nr:hypothetical protein SESBI_01594 [Sesbania bispinosa]
MKPSSEAEQALKEIPAEDVALSQSKAILILNFNKCLPEQMPGKKLRKSRSKKLETIHLLLQYNKQS